DDRDLATGDVRPLDLTLLDVEDQGDAAEVVRGPMVERQIARTHQLTRAGLDVASGEIPGHRTPPPGGRDQSSTRGLTGSICDPPASALSATHERACRDRVQSSSARPWCGWASCRRSGVERPTTC